MFGSDSLSCEQAQSTMSIVTRSIALRMTLILGSIVADGKIIPKQSMLVFGTGTGLRPVDRLAARSMCQNSFGSSQVGGPSRCCGKSSVMSNQLALLATWTWFVGLMPGSSSRMPSGRP
jgi:hypothetical protein